MAFCKGCGKTIEWHKTAAGKSIPLDPDPHPDGNLTFDEAMRVVVVPKGSKPRLFLSHFVTCVKADQFRRKNPKAVTCPTEGCNLTTPHRHCFECGATDHLAEDCPDGG